MLRLTDEELLGNKTAKKTYRQWMDEKITLNKDNAIYGWWTSRFGAWSWRLGARFSF